MIWMDYIVESAGGTGQAFRVKGDFPGEVMGKTKDGSDKDYWLYKPGDVYVVDENGWLRKMGKFEELLLREGHGRDKRTSRSD